MSLRDDFLEAFRSVKRDFFRDEGYAADNNTHRQETAPEPPGYSAAPEQPVQPTQSAPTPPPAEEVSSPSPVPDDVVFEAFRQTDPVRGSSAPSDDIASDIPGDTTPFGRYDPSGLNDADYEAAASASTHYGTYPPPTPQVQDGRRILDFDDGQGGDDKTIISKNTVIKGNLQTDDSIRLLGQVLGDIECKSNIVVAGKVRGNTAAANAYVFDAQVDGNLTCDDIISVNHDAWILGDLQAQQADIDGKIKGNIEIRHMVSIGPSSSVLGDISADELEIKRGAFINGQIMMYSPSRDVLDRFDNFED